MTEPGLSALRAAAGCLLGMGLGVVYSLLRPLRTKWTAPADLLFVLIFGAAWVYLGFGICRGDLRLGYSAALPAGLMLWELTAGKVLRPLFFRFWQGIWKILSLFAWPLGKIFQFSREKWKKLFASGKKSGTI